MREIDFLVGPSLEGQWSGISLEPALSISAPTLEELHLEAREALIRRLGASHVAYRIRLRRQQSPLGALSRGSGSRGCEDQQIVLAVVAETSRGCS